MSQPQQSLSPQYFAYFCEIFGTASAQVTEYSLVDNVHHIVMEDERIVYDIKFMLTKKIIELAINLLYSDKSHLLANVINPSTMEILAMSELRGRHFYDDSSQYNRKFEDSIVMLFRPLETLKIREILDIPEEYQEMCDNDYYFFHKLTDKPQQENPFGQQYQSASNVSHNVALKIGSKRGRMEQSGGSQQVSNKYQNNEDSEEDDIKPYQLSGKKMRNDSETYDNATATTYGMPQTYGMQQTAQGQGMVSGMPQYGIGMPQYGMPPPSAQFNPFAASQASSAYGSMLPHSSSVTHGLSSAASQGLGYSHLLPSTHQNMAQGLTHSSMPQAFSFPLS
jgi:hypothetical protein